MKLLRTTFHNYRVYAGKQAIDFEPPSDRKPVVLIGGLNGEGKTTLLEGLQLALYGKRSEAWRSNGRSYNDYLAQSIHRGADPSGGASVEVEFEAVDQDSTHVFKVQRSWRVNGGGSVKEFVQVFIDDQLDNGFSEEWADHVERFIPARLAGLFFFDGEKIKHYADPRRAQELIERGLLSLLGIDLLDQLDIDLKGLEARITSPGKKGDLDRVRAELESEYEGYRGRFRDYTEQAAELRNQHDRQLGRCEEQDRKFEKLGGRLYEQRLQLESDRKNFHSRKEDIESRLVELSSGVLPLALVRSALASCKIQMQIECHAGRAQITLDKMQQQQRKLKRMMKKNRVAKKTQSLFESFYQSELTEAREASEMPVFLDADEVDLVQTSAVLEEDIPNAQVCVVALLEELGDVEAKLQSLDRKLASVPDDETIAEVQGERDTARHELAHLDGRIAQIEEEKRVTKVHLDEAETRLHRYMVQQLEGSIDREDDVRVLRHAEKVRDTLRQLRVKLIERRVRSLQEMIRDSYVHLMRKKGMIKDISIDPDSYQLTLLNQNALPIAPEWLSAGERQLLVVSILWGFARASGRSLPVIVDTPLGRLDSGHRSNLVNHYFPHASHQVILLSTDEEIVGSRLTALQPWIGHTYRLVYDEAKDATTIENGYFQENANAH